MSDLLCRVKPAILMVSEQGAIENGRVILIVQNIFNKFYGPPPFFCPQCFPFSDVAFLFLGGSVISWDIGNIILTRGHYSTLGFQSLLEAININSEYPSCTKGVCMGVIRRSGQIRPILRSRPWGILTR